MIEVKVPCSCGQKYKFDVEPVNGQMPFAVNCPVCGADGTAAANAILAQGVPQKATPIAMRMSAPPPPPAAPRVPEPVKPPRAAAARARAPRESNLGLGVMGAMAGAVIGIGICIGFGIFLGLPFKWSGVINGILIGGGARIGYRGTSSTLGLIAALVTFGAWAATSFLTFGPALFEEWYLLLIPLLIGIVMAWKIAS
jgi:hypothetical protein